MKRQDAEGSGSGILRYLRGHVLKCVGRLSVQIGFQLRILAVRLEAMGRSDTPLPLVLETMGLLPFALLIFIVIGWLRSHHVPSFLEGCLFCLLFVGIRFGVSKVVSLGKPKLGLDPAESLIEPPLQRACRHLGKSLWTISDLWLRNCRTNRTSGSGSKLSIRGTIQYIAGNTLKYIGLFFLFGGFEGHIPREFITGSKTDT